MITIAGGMNTRQKLNIFSTRISEESGAKTYLSAGSEIEPSIKIISGLPLAMSGAAAAIGGNSVASIAGRIEVSLRGGSDVSEEILPLRLAMRALENKLAELDIAVPEDPPTT